MDKELVRKMLNDVKEGRMDVDAAMEAFRHMPFEDLGFACLDSHRSIRKGHPEVVFCQGKTPDQVAGIVDALSKKNPCVMATRAGHETFEAVAKKVNNVTYHKRARVIIAGDLPKPKSDKYVLVITAGTSDIPVAEEAAITAEAMANRVKRLFDVGVAGIHRVLGNRELLFNANVLVVCAGMEGALASIIGGLVNKPVIAVPTSVGYGASFHGLASLLSMLNSCAPGVAVVNIDNGFGAGYMASIINRIGD